MDTVVSGEPGHAALSHHATLTTDGALWQPGRPRLVVRVGVTGHRPNQLLEADARALERSVRRVLTEVRAFAHQISSNPRSGYDAAAARLVVVSPLAEGSDRLVACVGDALDFELQVPLPYPAAVYVDDFTTAKSKAEFEKWLGKASGAVLELDGIREDSTDAYRRVGRVTVENCDLLLAIWNGHGGKPGGTGETVREALRRRIPVVWISSHPPHHAAVLTSQWRHGQPGDPLRTLSALLTPRFVQPRATELYEAYFGPMPRAPWAQAGMRMFRNALLGKPHPGDGAEPGMTEPGCGDEASEGMDPGPPADPQSADYPWADALADVYGNKYRIAYIINYLLGAVAVLLALLSLPLVLAEPFPIIFASGEFGVIVVILLLTSVGRRRKWHERWLNYRLLAEQLRQADLLVPLGRTGPWFRGLPQMSPQPDDPWTTWLFRARVREIGLSRKSLTHAFLDTHGQRLRGIIRSQREYHARNQHTMQAIEHRLHGIGEGLFWLTLVACIVHLLAPLVLHHWAPGAVHVIEILAVIAAAFFPALSAATFAITSHGEYRGILRRSETMCRQLDELERQAEDIRGGSSDEYARVAEAAIQVMTEELLGWHVMLLGRPLSLPA